MLLVTSRHRLYVRGGGEVRRGVLEGEVVRVTPRDKDGTVLFEGDVR